MLETVLSVYMPCKGIWIPNRLHTTIHDEIVTELIVSSTMYTGESNAAKRKAGKRVGKSEFLFYCPCFRQLLYMMLSNQGVVLRSVTLQNRCGHPSGPTK